MRDFLSEDTLTAWRGLFEGQTKRVRALLEPFAEELSEIPESAIWNGWFESGDAELAYALLRSLRPARVIEIGSGYSSYFSARALRRNKCGHLTCIDPAPRVALPDGARHIARPWQEIDRSEFAGLAPNDVLFIDSSHGVEETLSYYPLLDHLPAGVLVHHHDFMYPYPATFPEENLMISYYAMRREAWEGMFSLSLLHSQMEKQFGALFPSSRRAPWRSPGSTWLRKKVL